MTRFPCTTITLLAALVAVVCAFPAVAQEGAATAPPPMACQNPGVRPLDRSSADAGKFQRKLDEYKKCVSDYSQTNGARANEIAALSRASAAKADELAVQSRAYSDAANNAVKDFNDYVSGLNLNSGDGGSGKAQGAPSGSAPKY